jgi:hypothetical protein
MPHTQALFLGKLTPRETSRLTERLVKFLIFKVVFCGALIIPDIYEIVLWLTWWVRRQWRTADTDTHENAHHNSFHTHAHTHTHTHSRTHTHTHAHTHKHTHTHTLTHTRTPRFAMVGYMRIFMGVARDRLDALSVSPSSTTTAHMRALALVLCILGHDLVGIAALLNRCARVCVRACARARVCARVRACVCVCARVCVCVLCCAPCCASSATLLRVNVLGF